MTATLPRLYLLDIEGTVAPISLTTGQLFPYARKHFPEFLRAAFDAPLTGMDESFSGTEQGYVQLDLLKLSKENRDESDPDAPRIELPPVSKVGPETGAIGYFVSVDREEWLSNSLKYIFWLMDRDRKSTALKSLQGKIWKAGFESGKLKGTLFPDVLPALTRWTAHGRVAIYSSGSASAQQLLFRHSIYGDLTHLIAGYFDTRMGAKTESASYRAIAAAMQVEPREVCFFSDVVRELESAREAGMETRLVVRDGNAPIEDGRGHVAINSFETTL
jgi:enolase-phosphatase E1